MLVYTLTYSYVYSVLPSHLCMQVQRVCDELYGKEADYVDWKHFLVCAAQPWPLPLPHQLLDTLERLQDSVGRGRLASRKQYMAVDTWMEERVREEAEEGFNRVGKLKDFFFDLFSDDDNQLDYTNMVNTYTNAGQCISLLCLSSCCTCVWTAVLSRG